jgi:hypothetical protein
MRTRHAVLLIAIAVLSGCANTFRSTDGARRESRRECLAFTRSLGWTVTDIGSARWLGGGQHEVQLTVEKPGTPSRVLRCVYDGRTRFADFPDEPRGP